MITNNTITGITLIVIGFVVLSSNITITNNMIYAAICFSTYTIITSKRNE